MATAPLLTSINHFTTRILRETDSFKITDILLSSSHFILHSVLDTHTRIFLFTVCLVFVCFLLFIFHSTHHCFDFNTLATVMKHMAHHDACMSLVGECHCLVCV